MPTPSCTFQIENDLETEMRIYLEPEGQDFPVLPGESIQVSFFGRDRPVAMRCSVDSQGRQQISFWPESGTYEITMNGRDVWDFVLNPKRKSAAR